ncbi:MAG: hypothetical protein H6742_01935 [Alphaproteobacteria bacterium]|nr:hypothetical protein [Alphaproteobacteria bacterium]
MSVGRTSVLLVPVAIAARGAAFLVPVVIANWYGVGLVTDAWFWALALPTFALVLGGSALATTAAPALARVRAATPERQPAVVGGLLTHAALWTTLGATLLCAAVAPRIEQLTDFPPDGAALARTYLWALLPFVVTTAVGSVLRALLEVHGRFRAIALTPLLRAGTVISVTWALLAPLGSVALPVGLLAGEVAQLLLWGALVRGCLGRLPRPGLELAPEVRSVFRDLAPVLGGELLVAMNLVVDKAFAGMLPEGAVATLEYADRARVIPQTLMESSLLMVAYATWSNQFAHGQVAAARAGVAQSLRWVLALSAPVLAGMYIGRTVLVALLYERGAFGAADTAATASVLGWYLPGVLPTLLGTVVVRAHIVERNLSLVLGLGLVSVLLNAGLNALLVGPMGLDGLALATTLNMLVVPGVYALALARTWRPTGIAWASWLQAGGIAVLAGLIAVAVELGPGRPTSLTSPVLWAAAVPCVALLGLGFRLTRPRRGGAP